MSVAALSRAELEALEDLPRQVRSSVRFLDPDIIRMVLQKYSAAGGEDQSGSVHVTDNIEASNAPAATIQQPSTTTSAIPKGLPPTPPPSSSSLVSTPNTPNPRMLKSATSTYVVPDWHGMSAATMTKKAITVHAQVMGLEHLQAVYASLRSDISIKDIHKHDPKYNHMRSLIRAELRTSPDYQESVTFAKHEPTAQGRIIERISLFCASHGWTWYRSETLLKALVMTMCTGASTTAKRRLKFDSQDDSARKKLCSSNNEGESPVSNLTASTAEQSHQVSSHNAEATTVTIPSAIVAQKNADLFLQNARLAQKVVPGHMLLPSTAIEVTPMQASNTLPDGQYHELDNTSHRTQSPDVLDEGRSVSPLPWLTTQMGDHAHSPSQLAQDNVGMRPDGNQFNLTNLLIQERLTKSSVLTHMGQILSPRILTARQSFRNCRTSSSEFLPR